MFSTIPWHIYIKMGYKNTFKNNSISFIPGICIDNCNKHAFIQVITNNKSYYIRYPIEEFSFNHKPFYIKIGNSFFSKDKLLVMVTAKISSASPKARSQSSVFGHEVRDFPLCPSR